MGKLSLKTIIHIGQHKTGTTSIQHYLQSHRSTLADSGLYVPDVLLGYGNPSHFLLNVYALDEERDSTAKIMLKETVEEDFFNTLPDLLRTDIRRHYQLENGSGCEEILWTNEGLYLLNSLEEYKRLRQLFEGFSDEIICVCCLRDRDSYRESFKVQLAGLGLPLSENKDSYRYLEDDSWLFDYDRKIQLLAQVFDEVMIMPYDPADMVMTFMEKIGYKAEGDTASLRLNTTQTTGN